MDIIYSQPKKLGMPKAILILLLATIFTNKLLAQVIINIYESPAYFTMQDISQSAFINTTQKPLSVTIQVKIKTVTHQPIVSIDIVNADLQPGPNFIPSDLARTARVQYSGGPLASQMQQTGVLPPGRYLICYYVNDATTIQMYAQSCNEQNSKSYTPPLLLSPPNGAQIETVNPMLVWLSPTPDSKNEVIYDLKLVEVRNGQSQYDAISNNYTHYYKTDYGEENILYPVDAQQLLENHTYAWRITAKFKDNVIGETETWRFTIKSKQPQDSVIKVKDKVYPLVNYNQFGRVYSFKDSIYFGYHNHYEPGVLSYKIVKFNTLEQLKEAPQVKVSNGLNLCATPINDRKFFNAENTYVLEINNSKSEKFYLPFKIKK